MQRKIFLLLSLLWVYSHSSAQSQLSVESIMRHPSWMGTFPSRHYWSANSQQIYFNYNPEKNQADSLYKIDAIAGAEAIRVPWSEEKILQKEAILSADENLKLYKKGNQVVLEDLKKGKTSTLFDWYGPLDKLKFLTNENYIAFSSELNFYRFDRKTNRLEKLTSIVKGAKPAKPKSTELAKINFLEQENLALLEEVRLRKEAQKASQAYRASIREAITEEFVFYTEGKNLTNLQLSPDARYVTFSVFTPPAGNKNTKVPNYTAASGYTEDLNSRPKVGTQAGKTEMGIYDLNRDTVYYVTTASLPGIQDAPDYRADYPEKTWEKKNRELSLTGPYFSPDGTKAILQARAIDNKDRWIASIDLTTGALTTLDRQRDEAWIGGPGIGWGGTLDWLPDSKHIYFQSEESGYSHLYLVHVDTKEKKALTTGKFEVFDPFLSKDKKSWYLTTSEVHPGERHFYRMPLWGGKMEKLTSMEGENQVVLSPDEQQLAILHSYSNVPTELYVQDNKVGAKPIQLTSGQSEEFKNYAWRDPELVLFTAQDGAQVPARLYLPEASKKNGAAVIFVHGAGYLQNVHKWWSSYFREYFFHNLLTDLGYTVLDIDYRGSAGYGRDWRTGIYRHMGGKDLSDQVDGANYLVKQHGVEAERIGIYGGSYGGFITLMALFNHGDVFASGAALRSVTDWAHYNHGYTANILNTPEEDPIAFRRSSPIYFAEGLKGNLLIAHGMLDVNVHFQDVVRLSQRLIELKKDNWEMAVYPIEDHGFVTPSSWTDEYKRILKLFNTTLPRK
uniref:prolyl oligopeptidase family serine peptidase n=1 Tax=Algoriphagus sp. TaxID=1872435 RepID=UPI004047AB7E